MPPPTHVLDSSVVLAGLLREKVSHDVAGLLPGALMCAVNVTEIVTRLFDQGWPMHLAASETSKLVGQIAPFDEPLALRAGRLRADTVHLGLSLGDRACLALGIAAALPVYTADRDWAKLDLGVDIRLIR